MTYEQWQWQRDLLDLFPQEYDPAYVPVWHASWCDYEESGWIYVLQKGTQYYVVQGGYSVMAEDNTSCWAPMPVGDAELWEILLDWEEHLD